MLLFHYHSKEIEIRKQMQTVIGDQAEVFFPFSHGSMLVCQSLVITLNILSSCWCPLVKLELLHSAQHRPVSQVRERTLSSPPISQSHKSCSLIGWYHAPAHPYASLLVSTVLQSLNFVSSMSDLESWPGTAVKLCLGCLDEQVSPHHHQHQHQLLSKCCAVVTRPNQCNSNSSS